MFTPHPPRGAATAATASRGRPPATLERADDAARGAGGAHQPHPRGDAGPLRHRGHGLRHRERAPVTRYELQLAPGTKVGRITALRDDLAYALAAREELRIIAPIPGKQAVGVEVPNPEASLVTLGDITREFPSHAGPLMAWLGLDLGGKPVYIDLAGCPTC